MPYANIDADYRASAAIDAQSASGVYTVSLNNAGLWKANYCAARNANVPLLLGWQCDSEGSGTNASYSGAGTISINGGSYNSFSLTDTYYLTSYGGVTRDFGSMIYGGTSISAYVYRSVLSIPAAALGSDHLTALAIRFTEGDGSYHTAYPDGTLHMTAFMADSYPNDFFGNMDHWFAMGFAGDYAGDVPSEGGGAAAFIPRVAFF